MTAIIIIILIIYGISCIPLLTKRSFPRLEKLVIRVLIGSILIYIAYIALLASDIRLKGNYTPIFIGLVFVFFCLLYFALAQINRAKIIATIILTPLILLSLFHLTFGIRVVSKYKISDSNNMNVCRGGFMTCGDILEITETKFLLFEKVVYQKSNLCLKNINKVEMLAFDKNKLDLLIHHDGLSDTENPYRHEIKNVW